MRSLWRFWPDVRARLGVYLFIFVLTLGSMGIALLVPMITGWIVDGPIARGDFAGMLAPLALILLIGIAEAAAVWLRRRLIAPITSRWEVLWRERLYDRLQYVAVGVHDAWPAGQLLSRAVNDLSQLRRFFAFGLQFLIASPLIVLGGGIILASLHPYFGIIAIAAAVPTVTAIAVLERRYRLASRSAQDTMGEIATDVEEAVQGIRILKAFGRSPWAAKRFHVLSERLRGFELTKAYVDSWMFGAAIMIPVLALTAILAVGTWGVIGGWMTVGQVIAALTVTMFLRMPIEMVGFLLADFLMSVTAANRYWEVMDLPFDITDPDGEISEDPRPYSYAGHIRFDAVEYRFADAEEPILTHIDLNIAPGETLALVGATGTGKTALAALLPRLQDVTAGSITLDGTDLRDYRINELRRIVSVAFEDPVLFSTTVRENVAMGLKHADGRALPAAGTATSGTATSTSGTATSTSGTVTSTSGAGDAHDPDAEVWDALEIAAAADFVRRLPDGLDTEVGEQGLSLSGGQRQRLALARAVIGKPRVLVLDDPLSAVDVDTEDRVQTALRQVLGDSTTLVIAHRPSTAALADRVAVLEGGRITDTGTHDELLARNRHYRDLMGASSHAAAETEEVRR
ncbi:ABC transporter ATP-binding protein/permease [Brevibacterium sp. p3-SID960]|uniref:ABC transporter ATP-binding protein n=1 Tax=Brevibacterium sp. p3-SID960 TaxID=2916063 RepID=UPI0021A57139|nr:ABC transporter ATP-binding protein [Brevibacterium sp. p3-SID960]MCT1691640.1 ABC transporter ATP-binding protein/permease [Brevibacterium sp. p3-SID960]